MTTWTSEQGTHHSVAPRTTTTRVHRLGLDGRPVPLLRGRIHEAAALPLAIFGTTAAVRVEGATARSAIVIFTASAVAMLMASAAYHCHAHTLESKLAARRLDHAMIFVAIAGNQTAYWLLVAPAPVAAVAILAVWAIAGTGIRHKLNTVTLVKSSGSWLYIGLGWTGLAMVPALMSLGDVVAFGAVLAGGLVYTGGGVVLARRLVDPWPGVFGYHEVWHLMVVVGVATHFAGIVRIAVTMT